MSKGMDKGRDGNEGMSKRMDKGKMTESFNYIQQYEEMRPVSGAGYLAINKLIKAIRTTIVSQQSQLGAQ